MKKIISLSLLTGFLLVPSVSFALPGVGPRVTIGGTVIETRFTSAQLFDSTGGELVVKSQNGQLVTVVLTDTTQIISEGRVSRKQMIPKDVKKDMAVRIRGWRVDSASMTASLVVVTNIELNPALSGNGVVQSFDGKNITFLSSNGSTHTYQVTAETEVHVSYQLSGPDALTLINKQAIFSVSATEPSQLKVLRITGNPQRNVMKPSQRTLQTTPYSRKR